MKSKLLFFPDLLHPEAEPPLFDINVLCKPLNPPVGGRVASLFHHLIICWICCIKGFPLSLLYLSSSSLYTDGPTKGSFLL